MVKNSKQDPSDGSVTVIVVNYDGGKRVLECLRSLEQQTYDNYHIVVVDNESVDGSLQNLRACFPDIEVIESGYNAGWGVAVNTGIEATRSEYIALLNNDVYLDKRCLEVMVETIQLKEEYGSCACKIIDWHEPSRMEDAGLIIYRDGSGVGRGTSEPAVTYQNIEEVFCANDCCCLYRRKMLNEIGLYDPDFFIYCDETDIGWRHQLAGWKCVYAPNAVAYHARSSAAGIYSDFKAYYFERNRIWITLKYFPFFMLISSFLFSFYRYVLQVWMMLKGRGFLARYNERSSIWRGLRILIKAHIDAIRMAPVMLGRRRAYKVRCILSNKEIGGLFKRFGMTSHEMAVYE